MIIDKVEYDKLEKELLEWEKNDEVTKNVSEITKELISTLKKSDKKELNTITAVLIFVIRSILNGPDDMLELCQQLYDSIEDERQGPGPGETAMLNEDGSYVTLKELGIE
jgi:hypothetical protein